MGHNSDEIFMYHFFFILRGSHNRSSELSFILIEECSCLPHTRCLAGSKLLTGGDLIQIWQFMSTSRRDGHDHEEEGSNPVLFHLGAGGNNMDPEEEAFNQRLSHAVDPEHYEVLGNPGTWDCVWKTRSVSRRRGG